MATVSEAFVSIQAIPVAAGGEYELSERETRRLRSLLYTLNKQENRKYRTLREGPYLMVWRIK